MSLLQRWEMPAQTCTRLPPAPPAPPTPPTSPPCWDSMALTQDDLPLDPRWWGREEVGRWVAARGGRPERFPMNGKALCLMTPHMFSARVPECGPALHKEFRLRLAKALAIQEFLEKMAPK